MSNCTTFSNNRFLYRQVSGVVTTPTQPVAMVNTTSNDSSSESQLTHTSISSEGNVIVKDQKNITLEPVVTDDTVPMETVVISDDDQPKPKPKRHDGDKEQEKDSPSIEYYFPAHPISYFTDNVDKPVEQGASSITGGLMEQMDITPTLESAEPMHLMVG